MAKARAIVKRLKAVRNIRKITRTMELVATARFKKAMDRATEAAAYTRKISEIVADLSATLANVSGQTGITHPLLVPHPAEKNATLLVLTSNRGLCGGYNAGILRVTQQRLREVDRAATNLRLEVSGKRGINFFRFQKQPVDVAYTKFEDKPTFGEVEALANGFIEAYIAGTLDRLDVAYMKFESMSRQRAIVETLLPIGQLPGAESAKGRQVDYEFLPSPQEILEEIVPASFKARLFKCFLDAAVSEQISRMVAMKSATENAGEMISTLKASYNRARQSQITSELSEIIGGAAALE
ncbi:MAG: ATP synthase F1 subunit gamma [Planctomycetales bacterium 12-60-4]|nr:MAG: ATP synthase F1 subunit gamma [Planctomycetales bacterium 12-60-4]